jgi:hypothetical protein
MIWGMSFLKTDLPDLTFPTGVVVVHAPYGVLPDLWMPVFIYASLSYMTYRMSSFLSAAADNDWMPMSAVPPSPAIPRTSVSSLPRDFSACFVPVAQAAVFSNATSW